MIRVIILAALCIGALLGDNTITIGEFSIKSTPQKDAMKIEIFKNKKPFQEIIENWESVCDINFLFTGIHGKEEPLTFGAICDGVYSAAEYEFDLKTNKFVYAGAVEEISIQELAQTKEHYIGLAYDSEEGGAYKEVLIFEKPSNRLIQTIYGGESKEEYDLGYSTHCFGACLSVGDYNFDGIEDFSLFYSYSRFGGEDRTYLLYDLKKRQFFLSELGGHNLIFDNNTKTIRQDIMHEVNYGAVEINAVFKVVNNKMQKIKEECALVHYDEESETFFKHDCKDGYWGGFWHLSSTGLKKNFELFAALSDDKAKGVVIYKGQSEFITLVLNAKNGGDYIYDEIYMGKKNGQYIFTINENGEVAVSYTNKDGKKI